MSLIVHSNKRRILRYYVTPTGKQHILFESDDASTTIQWAVDRCLAVVLEGEFTVQHPIQIEGKLELKGKKDKLKMS